MAEIVDCVERMYQFKQRCPDAEFDLKPYMFTARVPGRDAPFRAMSLCKLLDTVEQWAAEERLARLPSGAVEVELTAKHADRTAAIMADLTAPAGYTHVYHLTAPAARGVVARCAAALPGDAPPG